MENKFKQTYSQVSSAAQIFLMRNKELEILQIKNMSLKPSSILLKVSIWTLPKRRLFYLS